jgi:hypothetical protein
VAAVLVVSVMNNSVPGTVLICIKMHGTKVKIKKKSTNVQNNVTTSSMKGGRLF